MRTRLIAACAVAVLFAIGTTVYADTADRRTWFTFSHPVTLPGVTLPAGTYVFRLVDDTTSRRVVNVQDAAGTTSYAMLVTTGSERRRVTTNPEVQFMETAEGHAPAIESWWYPGQAIGYRFIYPREQLRLLSGSPTGAPALAGADDAQPHARG